MRGFKFYGDTNERFPFSGAQMQQYQEQVNRIRSNQRLTVASFVLMVLVIVETMFFLTAQLILKSTEYIGLLGIGIEIFTLVVVVFALRGYRIMSLDLRRFDLAAIIVAEVLFAFSEFMLYIYKQSFYMYIIAGVAFVLILYILLFFKAEIKQKIKFSAIPLVLCVSAVFLSFSTPMFTVRYVYISADGYYNEISNNDILHYYYTEPVNVAEFEKSYSNGKNGIYSVDELNAFCDLYNTDINMNELINFSRTYNDRFFKNNCLYITPVKLESSADRVSFNGFSYALSCQKPCIQYNKNNSNGKSNSVCVMLIEIPRRIDEKLNSIVEIKTDDVIMVR